ncbi:MAG TPA: hypothetical protein VMK12_11590 [Anaeromyxobacteraceae bacterium]|nr:hypothetical protein [Anaeromyxobacteraceae bacterium]
MSTESLDVLGKAAPKFVQFAKCAYFGAADLGPGGFSKGRFDGLRNAEAASMLSPALMYACWASARVCGVVGDECRSNESAYLPDLEDQLAADAIG